MKHRWLISIFILMTISCRFAGTTDISPGETDLPLLTRTEGEDGRSTETEMVLPTASLQPASPEETPTDTLVPLATQPAITKPAAIIARIEGGLNSFYLVGGSQNGSWVSGEEMVANLAADEEYQLYTGLSSITYL